MKKIILAVVLGLSVQTALAEVQVQGMLSFVAGGDFSTVVPALGSNEQVVSVDTSDPNYTDWNDPGEEFVTRCGVYPIGPVAVIDITSDTGKQAMSLAASANTSRQTVILLYHTAVDLAWPSGFKCTVDSVVVLGGSL